MDGVNLFVRLETSGSDTVAGSRGYQDSDRL